ncbi:Disease resistance protein Roq1 [Linum perenne]
MIWVINPHYWRSLLSELKLIQNLNVHHILRRSYNKLGVEEKKIFLDVACLLHGISRSRLTAYMVTKYPSAYSKVKDLIGRSLLTCVSDENEKKIVVHDLLKEMAWNIVNEEPKLHKRSRLVDPDDIHKLLTTSPTLNLMVLNLSYCKNLIEIPNISSSSYLEELLLYGCESLAEVFSHVQYLTKLITLDLRKCVKLKRLPPRLDSKLLKYVLMSHCLKVTHCPEVNSGELKELDLYETSLVELPSAIYNVKQDGTLHIYGLNITKFPAITSSLKTFELSHTSIREMDLHNYHHQKAHSELLLYENSQLVSLPKTIWNMVSYQLEIYGSPLIESLSELLEPVNGLHYLSIKNCKSLKSIPNGIHKLSKLSSLFMCDCESIRSLPELPPYLSKLNVSGCKSLQALPSNTGKLLHLESLQFYDCPQLDQTLLVELMANFLTHCSLVLDHQVLYHGVRKCHHYIFIVVLL